LACMWEEPRRLDSNEVVLCSVGVFAAAAATLVGRSDKMPRLLITMSSGAVAARDSGGQPVLDSTLAAGA